MAVEVIEASAENRTVVRRLLQFYHYDVSGFDGTDVDSHGEFPHRYLDHYWTEPDRKPFLFRVDGAWVGLALVFTGDPHDIAEFFVMRKYRRRGVGAEAAAHLFERFPGDWTVRQLLSNPAATTFWRKAIPYPFRETVHDTEVVQTFTATPAPAPRLRVQRRAAILVRRPPGRAQCAQPSAATYCRGGSLYSFTEPGLLSTRSNAQRPCT